MNKKGDYSEILVDIVAIFVLALILGSYWIIFVTPLNKKSSENIIDIRRSQDSLTLLNLLRSNARIDLDSDGKIDNGNIADLIVLSYKNSNFSGFESLISEKLKVLFEGTSCEWSIAVRDDGKLVVGLGLFGEGLSGGLSSDIKYIRKYNMSIPADESKSLFVEYEDNLLGDSYGVC